MDRLFANFHRARVLIVGDMMVDEYLVGNATRISPEAPVPVVEITGRRYAAGGAANVALNAVGLGAQVRLLGLVGNDRPAELLSEMLANFRIDPKTLLATSRPTTSKTRIMSGQQQIVRFDVEDRSALPIGVSAELISRFGALLSESDLCIISDYGKGVVSSEFSHLAIQIARKQNKPIIVDPKGRDYGKYVGCTLLTPNQKEASLATGIVAETESDVLAAGKSLISALPGSSVLITRGPDGMTLFRPKTDPLTISTEAQTVFDVVGAGDTVIATLGVAIGARLNLETAVRLSNIAAGIVVGKHGTVAVAREELLASARTSIALRDALNGRLCA